MADIYALLSRLKKRNLSVNAIFKYLLNDHHGLSD